VVRHVEQYEGETKVGVQGDMAIVQFINMNWVDKFRGRMKIRELRKEKMRRREKSVKRR
jgi:hypothetical protein